VRGTLARQGHLLVTGPVTARCRRFVPLSLTAERPLRRMRTSQAEERRQAGSVWQETGFVSTTETGEP
jgi:integrase